MPADGTTRRASDTNVARVALNTTIRTMNRNTFTIIGPGFELFRKPRGSGGARLSQGSPDLTSVRCKLSFVSVGSSLKQSNRFWPFYLNRCDAANCAHLCHRKCL